MSGRIITGAGEKHELASKYGARAVDMETFEIWTASEPFGIPVTAMRIVSDDADSDIPDFNRAYRADGTIIPAEMAAVMAAHPIVTARFLVNLRAALKSLRKGLIALIDY
jgi:nucleoside phosphorylase